MKFARGCVPDTMCALSERLDFAGTIGMSASKSRWRVQSTDVLRRCTVQTDARRYAYHLYAEDWTTLGLTAKCCTASMWLPYQGGLNAYKRVNS